MGSKTRVMDERLLRLKSYYRISFRRTLPHPGQVRDCIALRLKCKRCHYSYTVPARWARTSTVSPESEVMLLEHAIGHAENR